MTIGSPRRRQWHGRNKPLVTTTAISTLASVVARWMDEWTTARQEAGRSSLISRTELSIKYLMRNAKFYTYRKYKGLFLEDTSSFERSQNKKANKSRTEP